MNMKKAAPSSKRPDLQGIRGLAIIGVVLFHFWPKQFPHGRLGVDQFFVLSGYLMCMLLKRSEALGTPWSSVTMFYYRRFKRLLPIYLLVILVSLICLYTIFPYETIESNQESAVRSLFFVAIWPKPVRMIHSSMMELATDIFAHTWSLTVEVHFYIIVPFIFLFGTFMFPQWFQVAYYTIIAMLSFAYFSFSSSFPPALYVLSRVWQFSIGMIVYLLTPTEIQYQPVCSSEEGTGQKHQEETEQDEKQVNWCMKLRGSSFCKNCSYLFLILMFYSTFIPHKWDAGVIRPVMTMVAEILMLTSEGNAFLSNKVLSYIGNISYSLYLIHFPIMQYCALAFHRYPNWQMYSLLFSVLISIIAFETFEKWYLKLSSTSVGLLIVILFFLNVIAISKDNISEYIYPIGTKDLNNLTITDANRLNYRWSMDTLNSLYSPTCDYQDLNAPFGWCNNRGLSGHGKYKIVILGNSWAANHANLIYEECGYKAKSIVQSASPQCGPLYPGYRPKHICRLDFYNVAMRLKIEKPDYVFILTRLMSRKDPISNNIASFQDDPTYQLMKNHINSMIRYTRYKIFFLNALPKIKQNVVFEIAPMLENGTDPVVIDHMLVDLESHGLARKRYAELLKECNGKCELIDYKPEFYKNSSNTYRLFDENGLSYYTTLSQLTPLGIERVRHLWTDICRKL